jgi:hypothetical protein
VDGVAMSKPPDVRWSEFQSSDDSKHWQYMVGATFGPHHLVVRATEEHDRKQGIDLLLIDRRDARKVLRVDMKRDFIAARTGCLPIEHESVVDPDTGQVISPGWAVTSQADYIGFALERVNLLHMLSVAHLHAKLGEIAQDFADEVCTTGSTCGAQRWWTRFYRVPILYLIRHGIHRGQFRLVTEQGQFNFIKDRLFKL